MRVNALSKASRRRLMAGVISVAIVLDGGLDGNVATKRPLKRGNPGSVKFQESLFPFLD